MLFMRVESSNSYFINQILKIEKKYKKGKLIFLKHKRASRYSFVKLDK